MMRILNLSSLRLWDMEKGKGRLSTYLPIKGFVVRNHIVYYITNNPNQQTGNFDGVIVKNIKTFLTFKRVFIDVIVYPITLISFLYAGVKHSLRFKPDVIYSHSTQTALPAFLLAKLFGAKYVLRLYGISSFNKSTRFKSDHLFTYLAFKLKADLYILTDDGTAADRVAFSFGVPKSKVYFLKNGINKEWAQGNVDEELRKRIAPEGEKILLSVSRLAVWKQVDLIIKMFSQLVQINEKVRLLIVGDGQEMLNLKRLADDLKVGKYVIFVGSQLQSEISKYMRIADIFISMNALSSVTNPVFEAMVCGTPVIALNRGTTSELIVNNENGILVDDDQLNELPKIIVTLLENDALRQQIEVNARKNIMDNWMDWAERVEFEVNLIENLIRR